METPQKQIDNLRDRLNTLKSQISLLRKSGHDASIAEMLLMPIPSKIQMAEVTESEKDFEVARRLISLVGLEAGRDNKEENINKEIEKEVKEEIKKIDKEETGEIYKEYSKEEIIKRINKLINDATNYINNKEYYDALHLYIDMGKIYKYLPKEIKKSVYQDMLKIYRDLLKSELFKEVKSRSKINLPNIIKIFLKKVGISKNI